MTRIILKPQPGFRSGISITYSDAMLISGASKQISSYFGIVENFQISNNHGPFPKFAHFKHFVRPSGGFEGHVLRMETPLSLLPKRISESLKFARKIDVARMNKRYLWPRFYNISLLPLI